MKKQMDVYVPKIEYEPYKVFFWSPKNTEFVSTTLPDREIHPEPRVVDLTPTKE